MSRVKERCPKSSYFNFLTITIMPVLAQDGDICPFVHEDWTVEMWKRNFLTSMNWYEDTAWADLLEYLRRWEQDPFDMYDGEVIQCLLQRSGDAIF